MNSREKWALADGGAEPNYGIYPRWTVREEGGSPLALVWNKEKAKAIVALPPILTRMFQVLEQLECKKGDPPEWLDRGCECMPCVVKRNALKTLKEAGIEIPK